VPATFSTAAALLQFTALAPALRPLVAQMSAPERNSTVALVKGDSRRKNIAQAAHRHRRPGPARPEGQEVPWSSRSTTFSTVNQLAANPRGRHPRAFWITWSRASKGPRDRRRILGRRHAARLSSSSASNPLGHERRSQKVQLIRLESRGQIQAIPLIDYDLHAVSTRPGGAPASTPTLMS